jgi:hypothetical protein
VLPSEYLGTRPKPFFVSRQERRSWRVREHYGPDDFLQAPGVATRGFECLKPTLTGQTRLVPIPSPKMPLEYPETLSLLPSPDTYWQEGFETKPSQDLGHPFVWEHRSATRRGRLTRNGDCFSGRACSGRGTGKDTAPRCRGRGRLTRIIHERRRKLAKKRAIEFALGVPTPDTGGPS